jgi:transcriptional regulator with XRE-family HTH domain
MDMLSVVDERNTLAERNTKRAVKVCQADSLRLVNFFPMSTFGERLRKAFDNASNAEIARKIGVSEPAVGNYVKGRIPDAEKLLQISNLTNCNLHWLLTGEGKQQAEVDPSKGLGLPVDFPHVIEIDFKEDSGDRRNVAITLERRIREIVREELKAVAEIIDEYDIEAGVKKYDNALPVLIEWYAHDHLPSPDIGALAFSGWDEMSLEQKVKQIRNLREEIDEDREFEEASRHAPKNTKHS